MVNRVLIRLCSVTSHVTLLWAMHRPHTLPVSIGGPDGRVLEGPQPLLEA